MPQILYQRKVKNGSANVSHMRGKATSFFLNGFITGTDTAIKIMRPYIEKIITRGIRYEETKKVAHYRIIKSILFSKESIDKMFKDVIPVCKSKKGGYLRIVKISEPRKGDNSNISLLELVR